MISFSPWKHPPHPIKREEKWNLWKLAVVIEYANKNIWRRSRPHYIFEFGNVRNDWHCCSHKIGLPLYTSSYKRFFGFMSDQQDESGKLRPIITNLPSNLGMPVGPYRHSVARNLLESRSIHYLTDSTVHLFCLTDQPMRKMSMVNYSQYSQIHGEGNVTKSRWKLPSHPKKSETNKTTFLWKFAVVIESANKAMSKWIIN